MSKTRGPRPDNPTTATNQSFKKRFSALQNLPRFFSLVWQTNKTLTIANIGFRLLKSALPLLILYIGKEIIDQVVYLIDHRESSQQYLWLLVAAELGLTIISDLLNRCINLFDSLLGDLVANKTSVDLVHHAARLDLYQFENPVFYDKLERARRQTSGRTVLLSQTLTQMQDVLTLVSLGAGLVIFNPWLILILIVAVIPSFIGETHFNERTYSLTRSWTPERRELDYLRYLGSSAETAKEVKVFGLENYLANQFKSLSDKYYNANKKIAVARAGWGYVLAAIGTLAYYGAYVFVLAQTLSGMITIGTMTFLSGSFQRMHAMLQNIMGRFSSIAENALYLQDLFDFFAIQPTIPANENGQIIPHPIQKGIIFENVGFKYPDNDFWALRNLSFSIKPGEKLALVGENGAGKTTLVKLLASLYKPTEGRILIDGVDIQDYQLADLRANIGIIFQDYIRYEMTVSDNIAVGDIAHIDDKNAIESAANKSMAHELIDRLPNHYEQVLGKRFKDGTELSGGQWQKIALARAYMRDAQIIVLDEPTSALDARAEHEVFKRFTNLIEGKMAVLISHRFSTVRMADRILFLEKGKLIEFGSHGELIAQNGKYAELFNIQAQGYL
ncbi:Vitamin B12 import ATP-binding protein BtuD [Dyadobacter sp. CECT 9623]|uniref:Vitamin B12 import ATP-binding protein BtuD n=1 Tax=Dyadobacter linearis TaxID=2823330 RepID=A0ABM8URA8_9BACT|nr:ABC transporter ATP-binding protein [Dyadobacter sp. CECT 9623]CAG5070051.1 Vitamin B12 import ATP-binding protein BtuD [Dyadobacter sp. CECT 9623]